MSVILEIPFQSLAIEFHDSGKDIIFAGGSIIYLESDENDYPSSGKYIGIDDNERHSF